MPWIGLDWIYWGLRVQYNSIFTLKSNFTYNKYFLIQILSSYHWFVFLDKTDPWFGVYGPTKNKTMFCFLPSLFTERDTANCLHLSVQI